MPNMDSIWEESPSVPSSMTTDEGGSFYFDFLTIRFISFSLPVVQIDLYVVSI